MWSEGWPRWQLITPAGYERDCGAGLPFHDHESGIAIAAKAPVVYPDEPRVLTAVVEGRGAVVCPPNRLADSCRRSFATDMQGWPRISPLTHPSQYGPV